MNKKIKITVNGNKVKIKAENATLEDIAKMIMSEYVMDEKEDCDEEEEEEEEDECDGNCARCLVKCTGVDDCDEDDWDDEDEDLLDENCNDHIGEEFYHQMESFQQKAFDIVKESGYNVIAKSVSFLHAGMTIHGIEVTPAISGATNLAEYGLLIEEDGSRSVVQNGNGTLIIHHPIFEKPISGKISLENYHDTGVAVTCEAGIDTVKGISALAEILKMNL